MPAWLCLRLAARMGLQRFHFSASVPSSIKRETPRGCVGQQLHRAQCCADVLRIASLPGSEFFFGSLRELAPLAAKLSLRSEMQLVPGSARLQLLWAQVSSSSERPGGVTGRVLAQARCPGLSAATLQHPGWSSWSLSASLGRYTPAEEQQRPRRRQVPGPGMADRHTPLAAPPAPGLTSAHSSLRAAPSNTASLGPHPPASPLLLLCRTLWDAYPPGPTTPSKPSTCPPPPGSLPEL